MDDRRAEIYKNVSIRGKDDHIPPLDDSLAQFLQCFVYHHPFLRNLTTGSWWVNLTGNIIDGRNVYNFLLHLGGGGRGRVVWESGISS